MCLLEDPNPFLDIPQRVYYENLATPDFKPRQTGKISRYTAKRPAEGVAPFSGKGEPTIKIRCPEVPNESGQEIRRPERSQE